MRLPVVTLSAQFRLAFATIIGLQAILIAFVPLYFQSLGFSPREIAILSSAENIAGIFGPPILATLAVPRAISVLSFISALVLVPLLKLTDYWSVLVFWSLSLFLNRGALNRLNELAIRSDLDGRIHYARVRLWGSVSFVVVLQCIGVLVSVLGGDQIMLWCCGFLLIFALSAALIPDSPDGGESSHVWDFIRVGVDRRLAFFFLVLIGLWASHSPAYVYLSIHLDHFGWNANELSLFWNLGVLSEILIFYFFSWFERRWHLEQLITISLLFATLRWFLIGVTVHPAILLLTQTMHSFTFALSFIASQKLISLACPNRFRRSGQAMLAALTSGFGSLVGKLAAGYGAEVLHLNGDFSVLFLAASGLAALSLTAWCLAVRRRGSRLFPESAQLV